MADEGKFARAMAISGAGEKLLPSGEAATEGVKPVVAAPRTEPKKEEFRRVSGCCTTPQAGAVMVHDMSGPIAGQFRALRSWILALRAGKPLSVITVTSATRGEGKTTVAYNLAIALSEVAPGRVVVVDGDLRGPSLHILAGVRGEVGLNAILENGLDLSGHVYETSVPNLDLIPSQPAPATDHLESKLHNGCKQLLANLRRSYAFVIIDTPPVLIGSQATLFGKHSDGVILVARLEKTSRQAVKHAQEELVKVGAPVLGCVLTHHKYHVPDFIYRFFGSTSSHYYNYRYRKPTAQGAGDVPPAR